MELGNAICFEAKNNLAQKYENLHKNNWAPPFFFFFFYQSGVGWAREMDSPREKTNTSHLKQDSDIL